MDIKINIKEEQFEFLKKIENEFSITGSQKVIQILINKILEEFDNEIVFGEIRCVGECFSNEEFIVLELEDQVVAEMKDIFKRYDFEDYDSEEEELAKVVRCIINFADKECDMDKIITT